MKWALRFLSIIDLLYPHSIVIIVSLSVNVVKGRMYCLGEWLSTQCWPKCAQWRDINEIFLHDLLESTFSRSFNYRFTLGLYFNVYVFWVKEIVMIRLLCNKNNLTCNSIFMKLFVRNTFQRHNYGIKKSSYLFSSPFFASFLSLKGKWIIELFLRFIFLVCHTADVKFKGENGVVVFVLFSLVLLFFFSSCWFQSFIAAYDDDVRILSVHLKRGWN